ncbi:anti-sigma factor [Portibacter lacus]|uniref:Anti-sigma factor n=1 Tax=Portibacter lacus TaxID=1099794 RepID=A0AA37WGL3_9BACT|nr:anti-sigma factor [Portibacter lacus]
MLYRNNRKYKTLKGQQNLIQKYLEGQATEEEIQSLDNWVKQSMENEAVFKDAIAEWNVSSKFNSEAFDTENAFNNFLNATKKHSAAKPPQKTIIRSLSPAIKVVASIAAILVLSFYFFYPDQKDIIEMDYADQIILKSDDGSIKIIEEDMLLSFADDQSSAIAHYDEIIVPFGKTFTVVLSDGSTVKLNSGSTLKFPEKFTSDLDTRSVVLEGEAFFDVEKNEKQPFIVQTSDMNIKVLGTSFNVSAYADDASVKTILVEGRVNISDPQNVFRDSDIIPNQMAVFDKTTSNFDIVDVNALKLTSWTRNKLLFNDKSFEDITKIIERRYNVQVINNYDTLNNIKFYGEVVNESIEDVFETFSMAVDFNYIIKDGSVTLNKPE